MANTDKKFDILDCLLPNGVVVPLACTPNLTLKQLKEQLWKEGCKYPSWDSSGSSSDYVVVGVTRDSRQTTLWDEDQPLTAVPLSTPCVKLIKPKQPPQQGKLNAQIDAVIGCSVQELDECSDPEVHHFRKTILEVVCDSISCRERRGLPGIALYHYPPLLDTSPSLPLSLTRHLDHGCLHVAVWVGGSKACSVRVLWSATPSAVVRAALHRLALISDDTDPSNRCDDKSNTTEKNCKGATSKWNPFARKDKKIFSSDCSEGRNGANNTTTPQPRSVSPPLCINDSVTCAALAHEHPSQFVLKVCGSTEYLLAEEPITQYKTIRGFVSRDKTPQLLLLPRSELHSALSPHILLLPSYATSSCCWKDSYTALRREHISLPAGDRSVDVQQPADEVSRADVIDTHHTHTSRPNTSCDGSSVDGKLTTTSHKQGRVAAAPELSSHQLSTPSSQSQVVPSFSDLCRSNKRRLCADAASVSLSDESCVKKMRLNATSLHKYSSDPLAIEKSYVTNEMSSHIESSKSISTTSQVENTNTIVTNANGVSSSYISKLNGLWSKCCNFKDCHNSCNQDKKSATISHSNTFTPSLSHILNGDLKPLVNDTNLSCSSNLSGCLSGSDGCDVCTKTNDGPNTSEHTAAKGLACCSCCQVSNKNCAAESVNLWHPSLEGRLKIKIISANDLHVKPGHKVMVYAGVYQGPDELCCHRRTTVAVTAKFSSSTSKASLVKTSSAPAASCDVRPAAKNGNTALNTPQLDALLQLSECVKRPQDNLQEKTVNKLFANVNSKTLSASNSVPICSEDRAILSENRSAHPLLSSNSNSLKHFVGINSNNTADKNVKCNGNTASWSDGGELLEFELNLQDCPRATKICFSLVSASGKEDESCSTVLGCHSINLFDWRGNLLQETVTLPLCSSLSNSNTTTTAATEADASSKEPTNTYFASNNRDNKSTSQLLYPHLNLRFVGANRWSSNKLGSLTVAFEQHIGACSKTVMFPSLDQVLAYARTLSRIGRRQAGANAKEDTYVSPSDEQLSLLCQASQLDPFTQLSSGHLKQLWELRNHAYRVPSVLPRLLQAVDWANRDMVSQLYLLLSKWWCSSLPVSVCIEVLRYPDPVVRHTAVQSLAKTLTHQHIQKYLLQLVQCVLQEPYLWSPLLQLLLHRALTNSTLGYRFLHHLKCNGVCVGVLAILEAYCRGVSPVALQSVLGQVNMLNTLNDLGAALSRHTNSSDNKELSHQLQKELKSRVTALEDLNSPLYPAQQLGRVKLSACCVLDSARKPLKIVWQNLDPLAHLYATDYSVIFKRGDDLRQDELSLQVLTVMGAIWAEEGLDLRMTAYTCLAMRDSMGIIELVNNAKTVYSIQRRARLGAIQVDSSQLYKWIKEHNRGPRLAQAIDTFTQSCAGYCVATFVLGIGDRHPDNIMVNEHGQIFHIDFGHFLGNYKKKFGLPRERVPFVLTQDFLRVIAGGAENPKDTSSFTKFEDLCCEAYLALRRHSRLLLALFALLLDTGLPELQSGADLRYLHRSLGAWCTSEEEALTFFRQQFLQASGGAWTTKLDWFFHSVKHR